MYKTIISCIALLFLCVSFSFSQQHITFNHLTVDDGLSQSSVTCIFQDSKGFMWFGTQDGLNRYDGYKLKIYKNDPSDSTTLKENFIFSIYENPDTGFYVETRGGILHKYNPPLESFSLVNKDSINLQNAKISTVGALLNEAGGIVWTGGLGSGTGLKRTDTRSGQSITYTHNPQDEFSLSDNNVYSIFRDHSGNLWIGTKNGLNRLDEETGRFFHYYNDPENPNSLPDNWVWPIYQDSQGYLWLGTVRGGLSRFDITSNSFTNFRNDPNDPTSINNDFIYSIYEDKGSVLWVGTNTGGLNYFHPLRNSFEHYKNDAGNKNSLNDNLVSTLLVSNDGTYWIGTSSGGVNKFDYTKNRFTSYLNNPDDPGSISSNSIQSLYEDKSGIIWIGTFSSGLDAFDVKNGTIKHYVNNPSDSTTLSDNRIYALTGDNENNIWIGTYGGGLNKLDKNSGFVTHYQHNENDSTSLSSNATWSLAFDADNRLWIGTFGGGVNILSKDGQSFSHFKNIEGDSTSIADNNIIRVFKDSKGMMWIGTTKGLSKFSPESNTFKNYDESDGLSNSLIYGIVEDNNGYLWLSTNNGLSKFDPEKEIFKNYYYKNGLQGNEFNQNAYAKDRKRGNLLFGGPNGFNVFNPDNLKDNTYIPPVQFTAYTRYNTDDEEGKPIFEKGITARDTIILSYKDNIITLEFAALSYYNNLENQYRYKLEGFNENWIQLGNKQTVTFTNLSAGEYVLNVTGSNNDGVWSESGKSLAIIVYPPWWQTKIAYTIYFLAFFGLLSGLRRFELNRREQKAQIRESALRIKATEAEKRALEIENERKTKELEQARQLQLSMLPKELPELPDMEIAAFMRTATEVGGDYYDFNVEEDGTLNVAFGDATGHGLQAGTMVTLMKGFFTSDSSKFSIQEFMSHCTRVIKEIKLGRILMSFSYLKIKEKKLLVSSAGMPPIFYHSREKKLEEILIQGMPLGAMKNANYTVVEKELTSGDTILLLTDGLPEQMNKDEQMFDYTRVKEQFTAAIDQAPASIIKALVDAGDAWMNGKAQDDDITFVVIKIK